MGIPLKFCASMQKPCEYNCLLGHCKERDVKKQSIQSYYQMKRPPMKIPSINHYVPTCPLTNHTCTRNCSGFNCHGFICKDKEDKKAEDKYKERFKKEQQEDLEKLNNIAEATKKYPFPAHRLKDVIIHWAKGGRIQFRRIGGLHEWQNYEHDTGDATLPAFYLNELNWRIAPEKEKIKYRIALFRTPTGDAYSKDVYTSTCHTTLAEQSYEDSLHFICWLGDWETKEYTIPETKKVPKE